MKPLPFDMTPLAKALEMPANSESQHSVKRRVGRDRVAIYPKHIVVNRGYASTVAQEQVHALAALNTEQATVRGSRA